MHPGRILGIVVGLAMLGVIFSLPITMAGYTLYGIVGQLLGNMGALQSLPYQQMVWGYGLVVSFILLAIAGVVGFFPLGTGVLGVHRLGDLRCCSIHAISASIMGSWLLCPVGSLDSCLRSVILAPQGRSKSSDRTSKRPDSGSSASSYASGTSGASTDL